MFLILQFSIFNHFKADFSTQAQSRNKRIQFSIMLVAVYRVNTQFLCHCVVMYSVRMVRFLLSSSRQNICMAAFEPYFS